MRLSSGKRLLLSCMLVASFPLSGAAEGAPYPCRAVRKDILIRDIVAGAGFWQNFRNQPGSINFESNAIFEQANAERAKLEAPENLCPKGCAVSKYPVLIFSSAPRKVLSEYDDAALCASLYRESSQNPYIYESPPISSIEELNEWIEDLSRGNGRDGGDLYERCSGACSPRYEYTISKNDAPAEGYTVRASIICGDARDKDDNQYDLRAFFRWSCASP